MFSCYLKPWRHFNLLTWVSIRSPVGRVQLLKITWRDCLPFSELLSMPRTWPWVLRPWPLLSVSNKWLSTGEISSTFCFLLNCFFSSTFFSLPDTCKVQRKNRESTWNVLNNNSSSAATLFSVCGIFVCVVLEAIVAWGIDNTSRKEVTSLHFFRTPKCLICQILKPCHFLFCCG